MIEESTIYSKSQSKRAMPRGCVGYLFAVVCSLAMHPSMPFATSSNDDCMQMNRRWQALRLHWDFCSYTILNQLKEYKKHDTMLVPYACELPPLNWTLLSPLNSG